MKLLEQVLSITNLYEKKERFHTYLQKIKDIMNIVMTTKSVSKYNNECNSEKVILCSNNM